MRATMCDLKTWCLYSGYRVVSIRLLGHHWEVNLRDNSDGRRIVWANENLEIAVAEALAAIRADSQDESEGEKR